MLAAPAILNKSSDGPCVKKGPLSIAERRQIVIDGILALVGILEASHQVVDNFLASITPKDAADRAPADQAPTDHLSTTTPQSNPTPQSRS